MQHFFSKLYWLFKDLISVSQLKRILQRLKKYWLIADVSGKILIIIFFAPSLFVLFWLLIEIAYVIVFTLPGIVIKIISLTFLFCIFWSAAVYFYEKLHGMMSDKTEDAEKTDSAQNTQNAETKEPEAEKKFRWRRKT